MVLYLLEDFLSVSGGRCFWIHNELVEQMILEVLSNLIFNDSMELRVPLAGLLVPKGTVLAHGQLLVHQDPQVALHGTAFHQVSPQPILVHGVIPL